MVWASPLDSQGFVHSYSITITFTVFSFLGCEFYENRGLNTVFITVSPVPAQVPTWKGKQNC